VNNTNRRIKSNSLSGQAPRKDIGGTVTRDAHTTRSVIPACRESVCDNALLAQPLPSLL